MSPTKAQTDRTAQLTAAADRYIGERNPMLVQIKQLAFRLDCSEKQAQRIRQSIHIARGKPKPPHSRPPRIFEAVEAAIGDRDPATVPGAPLARELGVSESMVSLAKRHIAEKRANPQPQSRPEAPRRSKRERLFWTEGARLFSANREPAEVGT